MQRRMVLSAETLEPRLALSGNSVCASHSAESFLAEVSKASRSTANDLGIVEEQAMALGSVGTYDRQDFYRFELAADRSVDIQLDKHSRNVDLYLHDHNGRRIAQSTADDRQTEQITDILAAGEFFVEVRGFRYAHSDYRLTVETHVAGDRLPGPSAQEAGAASKSPEDCSANVPIAKRSFLSGARSRLATRIAATETPDPPFDGTPRPPAPIKAPQLAFPGAEGMGKYAQGGRDGDVYHVTNLDDAGKGSLRFGINSAKGPRTIVFDVDGTIELESRLTISNPYLTITGQTAPGEGITITGQTVQVHDTHDVIIQYLRIRPGDKRPFSPESHDGLAIRRSHDVMIDHVSIAWAIDENLSFFESENVTIQWSIISESLVDSLHPLGHQGFANLTQGGAVTMHHNLFAHHNYRMPRIKDADVDFVNNVVYNWSSSNPSLVGTQEVDSPSNVNFENNAYVSGPSVGAIDDRVVIRSRDDSLIWAKGNLVDHDNNGVLNFDEPRRSSTDLGVYIDERHDFERVPTESVSDAYDRVLQKAGASLVRDVHDQRVVDDVIHQTGSTINSPSAVPGHRTGSASRD